MSVYLYNLALEHSNVLGAHRFITNTAFLSASKGLGRGF